MMHHGFSAMTHNSGQGAPNPPRAYQYDWWWWLFPLFFGLLGAGAGALALAVDDRDVFWPDLPLISGGLFFAASLLKMLRGPYRFVLYENSLEIHWLWRTDKVPMRRIELEEPAGEDSNAVVVTYDNRQVRISGFCGLKTELLLRGTRIAQKKLVTVSGSCPQSGVVPLMLLFRDRARLDLGEAKEQAFKIVKGKQVTLRIESERDTRELKRELRAMGLEVRSGDSA
jgi:hypothetical protein